MNSGFESVIFKSGRCGKYLFYAAINLLNGEDEYFLSMKTHTVGTEGLFLYVKWCASLWY